MAIVLGQGAFGGCTDMSEDQSGRRLWCNSFKIDAVPCWKGRGEDTWIRAHFWLGIPPYAKSVAIDWSSTVKTQSAVIGLGQDAV